MTSPVVAVAPAPPVWRIEVQRNSARYFSTDGMACAEHTPRCGVVVWLRALPEMRRWYPDLAFALDRVDALRSAETHIARYAAALLSHIETNPPPAVPRSAAH